MRNAKELVHEIKERFKNVRPPLSDDCCIYRVPKKLRKVNEAAYTPDLVSIGPFHHGKKDLEDMENDKLRFVEMFLQRGEIMSYGLDEFASFVKDEERRIRDNYSEPFDDFSSDKFVTMILVDAVFIIELFLIKFRNASTPLEQWKFIYIGHDLMLLENQIPFFVLDKLYDSSCSFCPNFPPLFELTYHYFHDLGYSKKDKSLKREEVKHFTDYLRLLHLPATTQVHSRRNTKSIKKVVKYCIDLQPSCHKEVDQAHSVIEMHEGKVEHAHSVTRLKEKGEVKEKSGMDEEVELVHGATELYERGVTFKKSSSECLLDIEFVNGELKIPCLQLYDETESFIRNLIVLEQCHYLFNGETYICDYFWFLDYLINTTKDVNLLVQKKIIVNWLGNHEAVATLVNKLSIHVARGENSYYSSICRDLKEYYETPGHVWTAVFRDSFFSNPWRSVATILLVPTLIQTIYAPVVSILL